MTPSGCPLTASSLVLLQGGRATALGTLATSGPVVAMAGSWLAGNMGTIGDVLISGGELSNAANNGFTAGLVTNVGGTLSQGFGGTVSVTGYIQLTGTLEVTLGQDPFELSTGVLASSGSVALQGGTLRVKALPEAQGFAQGLTFDIVTAASGIVLGSVAFETVGFPAGYSASLSSLPGKLVLTIQKAG